MTTDMRTRLVDVGWTLACEKHIEIDTRGPARQEQHYCLWRATKGMHEVVVRARWDDQHALAELYKAAKAIDPDLRQRAIEAGSGAWIIDPNELEKLTRSSE
jgi:hypothetical protein